MEKIETSADPIQKVPGEGRRRPESVLVVVIDSDNRILLLKRQDLGFWQSITGSLKDLEYSAVEAAIREMAEETAIRIDSSHLIDHGVSYCFRIHSALAWRFADGVTHNTEHLFEVRVKPGQPIEINPDEHVDWQWCDAAQALELAWSWSNRMAIRHVTRNACSLATT